MERLAFSDPSRPLISAEIALLQVELDISRGNLDQAASSANAVFQSAARAEGLATSLRLRALSLAAYVTFAMGRRTESLSLSSSLLSELSASQCEPHVDRVELFLMTAIVLAELDRFPEASRTLGAAWLMARQGNLKLDMIRLDLMDTLIRLDCGEIVRSTERLRDISLESRRLSCPNISALAYMYLARAQVQALRPRPKDILESVQLALDSNPDDTAIWIECKIAESFARLMLGDVQEAERAARAADDVTVTTGMRAYRCGTLRELARVAYMQGRKRDAKRTIIAAIEAGYTVGKPQQSARALDLAAEILQQSSYSKEAAALRRMPTLAI
jgi:tetratricopeptide (TPR) repeat protein